VEGAHRDREVDGKDALFAPIPMGFAETSLAESFRPPTWLAAAEMSDRGRLRQGSRRPLRGPRDGLRARALAGRGRRGRARRNSPYRHLLGCDGLGRDLLVRLLYGARVSLSVGLLSAAALFAIGAVVGLLAGAFGGWVDLLLSRGIEVVLCFPAFFLVLLVLSSTDPDVLPPVLAVSLVIAASVALRRAARPRGGPRPARGRVRGRRARPRRPAGPHPARPRAPERRRAGDRRRLVRGRRRALVEAALSYLGFGVRVPIPSWGSLVNESRSPDHWWLQLFPGLAILVSVASYNLVGDAVREALDPRTATRREGSA
jgi:peptide/nickel transport system permease protein